MINAKEARAQADAVIDAAVREKEAKIEAQWAVWGPKVESAIKSACDRGLYSAEVGINATYDEAKDLDDMVKKYIGSHGYATEFKWRDRNLYCLSIYW